MDEMDHPDYGIRRCHYSWVSVRIHVQELAGHARGPGVPADHGASVGGLSDSTAAVHCCPTRTKWGGCTGAGPAGGCTCTTAGKAKRGQRKQWQTVTTNRR